MRPFRFLLVLTFLGAPVWAQPVAQEAPVEAAAPPVEVGAGAVEAQAAPELEPEAGSEAPAVVEDTSPVEETPVGDAQVVGAEPPVVEAPVVEKAPEAEAQVAVEPPVVEAPVVEKAPEAEAQVTVEETPAVEEAPVAGTVVEAPPPAPAPVDEPRPSRRLRAMPAQVPVEAVVMAEPAPPARLRRADPMNELALVAGWNAPSGWGGRYLRRLSNTPLAVGAGLAPLTMWGLKLSLIVRRSTDFQRGLFQQLSVGFSTGADKHKEVLVDEAGSRNISLRKTPGRTLDFVVGYRWPVFTRSFTELFTGWSFNFQGTYLQNAEVSKVPIPQSLREDLDVQTPGGLVLGVTFGWRF